MEERDYDSVTLHTQHGRRKGIHTKTSFIMMCKQSNRFEGADMDQVWKHFVEEFELQKSLTGKCITIAEFEDSHSWLYI